MHRNGSSIALHKLTDWISTPGLTHAPWFLTRATLPAVTQLMEAGGLLEATGGGVLPYKERRGLAEALPGALAFSPLAIARSSLSLRSAKGPRRNCMGAGGIPFCNFSMQVMVHIQWRRVKNQVFAVHSLQSGHVGAMMLGGMAEQMRLNDSGAGSGADTEDVPEEGPSHPVRPVGSIGCVY